MLEYVLIASLSAWIDLMLKMTVPPTTVLVSAVPFGQNQFFLQLNVVFNDSPVAFMQ